MRSAAFPCPTTNSDGQSLAPISGRRSNEVALNGIRHGVDGWS
jgi:hypothetical protein